MKKDCFEQKISIILCTYATVSESASENFQQRRQTLFAFRFVRFSAEEPGGSSRLRCLREKMSQLINALEILAGNKKWF